MVEDTRALYSTRPTQSYGYGSQPYVETPYTSPTRQGEHHPARVRQSQGSLGTSQVANAGLRSLLYGNRTSSANAPTPNSSIAITQHKPYQPPAKY